MTTIKTVFDKLNPYRRIKIKMTESQLKLMEKFLKPVDEMRDEELVASFIGKVLKDYNEKTNPPDSI